MPAWDNVALPSAPSTRDYFSPLIDFSTVGNLANTYFQGRANRFADTQQQRELARQQEFAQGLPKDAQGNIDWRAAVDRMARFGLTPAELNTAATQGIAQEQFRQAQQPTAIFSGTPSGGATAPTAAAVPSAASAAPQRVPVGGYTGGDAGENTVASIVGAKLPENDQKTGVVMANIAKAVGADPNAPLTPEQGARAQRLVEAYTARTTAPSGAVTPAPDVGTQPIIPQAAPVAGPAPTSAAQPNVILPPGYSDPRKAVIDLRKEAARASANPHTRETAREYAEWATRIEEAIGAAPGKRSFGITGYDQNGLPQYGFVDPYSQTVKVPQGATTNAAVDTTSQLTGQAYLDTLDPGRASEIKAIVEGRMQPPNSFALKSPQMQALLRQVAQYEPGFDLTKWGGRAATFRDFSAGKSSQNITAFNTAIAHLDTLDKAAEKLGNRWSPSWNTVANMVTTATGDARVKEFDIAKTAVADELTRAFRGSGGNVHDIVQWEKAINSSGSPEQLKGAIKQAVELLRGRIEALGDTYNRGMNTSRVPISLLSDKAQKALGRLTGGTDTPVMAEGATAKQGGGAETPNIPRISSKAEYDKLKSGASFIGPDGKPWQKP